MLRTEAQSEGDSLVQSFSFRSGAEPVSGWALGPEIPALVTGWELVGVLEEGPWSRDLGD